MKKLIAVVLIVVMALGLTGCYSEEVEIYNAMKKMQDIKTMQSQMEMDFTFDTEGFSEEEQMIFEEVAQVINGLKVEMNMKQTQNEDQTKSSVKMDSSIKVTGMDMDMKQWVKVDLSEDKPEMIQIMKMPGELMATMLPSGLNKEYIRFDMMDQEALGDDFDELMEFSQEFQPKLMEFIDEFYNDFDFEMDFITKKDSKVVNGKQLNIYEIKLDDSALKKLVRYSVNHTLENEGTMDFLSSYMDAVISITAVPEGEKDEMETEIKSGLKELETQLPEFKKSFNEFMDKYEDIEILGEDGISIEIGIDKKGYLVHEAGKIDMRIDVSQISTALGLDPVEGIINLGINYTTENYNINNKLIWVRMPYLTKWNSIEYMDLLEEQQRQLEEQLKQLEEMEGFENYEDFEGWENIQDLENLEDLEELEEEPAA